MVLIGKDLNITSAETLFMLALKASGSISGSEIVKKITNELGEEWIPTPGATYKILQSLQKKELIQETTESEEIEDQRIRVYKLTEKGRENADILCQRITKLFIFMNSCCPGCCDGVISVQ